MPQKSSTIALLNNKKLLLLKRGDTAPWQPNKYCLVGGGVEDNESLMDAAHRECFEETGIILNKSTMFPMTISYKNGYSKIVFFCKVSEPKVSLNFEHSSFGWFSYDECLSLYNQSLLVPRLFTIVKCLMVNGHIS